MYIARTRLGDHWKYHKDYEKAGFKVYASWKDEWKDIALWIGMRNFHITPFENPHGDIKSYGFYIKHNDLGKLIFVTDAEYVKYDFSALKVNHILIECNWQKDLVDFESPNFKHKVTGHMSLDTCKAFVKHNASSELRNVVLIHSSAETLDYEFAVSEIRKVVDVDVNVVIAKPGMEIELNKEAF